MLVADGVARNVNRWPTASQIKRAVDAAALQDRLELRREDQLVVALGVVERLDARGDRAPAAAAAVVVSQIANANMPRR